MHALKCLLHHMLWWPRVVWLQQTRKSAPLLLSVTQIHWNAYCSTSFWDLVWFVCNKCTNLSHCCFQVHKYTEMLTAPHALVAREWFACKNAQICPTVDFSCTNALKCLQHHKLWWPRVVCLQQMYKSAQLLLPDAQMHWNAYYSTGLSCRPSAWCTVKPSCDVCTESQRASTEVHGRLRPWPVACNVLSGSSWKMSRSDHQRTSVPAAK